MSASKASPQIEDKLLSDFRTYDQHADVVSALEWLFTDASVKDLPDTVQHFERFPTVPSEDGRSLTPDFTVLFRDGTAIVGEIARFALLEGSVDKLCRQLHAYSLVRQVPNSDRTLEDVDHVDVLYIPPAELGNQSIKRIIAERFEADEHEYAPPRPPCIAQYSATDSKYIFQRLGDARNGTLIRPTNRTPNVIDYLNSDLVIRADEFARVKVQRLFTNDPVPPLYLATQLWARTWPTAIGASAGVAEVSASATFRNLQRQYGQGVSRGDVDRALALLQSAGLVIQIGTEDRWVVQPAVLGRGADKEISSEIARRAASQSTPSTALARAARPEGVKDQGATALFTISDTESELWPSPDALPSPRLELEAATPNIEDETTPGARSNQ